MTHPSEARIRRAIRHLRRSGRRLVRRSDGWAIAFHGAPVARLSVEEVAFLAAEGHVVEAEGGGMVLASASTIEATSAPDVPPSGAWVFEAAGCPRMAAHGRGFEKLARRAHAGEGPLTLRQAEAGLRLIADAEQAARTSGLTMDWTNTVTDRQRRRGRDGGMNFRARSASRRLEKAAAAAGEEAFALAWRACIERHPISKLAAHAGVNFRAAIRRLAAALEKIACAYDGCR